MTSAKAAKITWLEGRPPMPGDAFDLADFGYVEEEYLLEGVATAFEHVGPRGLDGRWTARPAVTAPFITRLVVRRPLDAASFSGVALVEWNNVTAGIDAMPDWSMTHRQILRAGHAYVGVAAQKAGIDGGGTMQGLHLKQLFPARYGVLNHPGDLWSFDMFTQAGAVLTGPDSPLAPLKPRRVIAMGESQSAMHLVTYINAVDALARVFDGFLVHGRGATGAPLDGVRVRPADLGDDRIRWIRGQPAERIRDDARVPVMVVQTETDVAYLGSGLVGQADGPRLREWEIAGAAHADTYLLVAASRDDGRLAPDALARLFAPTENLPIGVTATPINGAPQHHYVTQAALQALIDWADGGPPPPSAPRLEPEGEGLTFRLDANGNALGGVRTPWVDAPTALQSGVGQTGGMLGFLFGRSEPFDAGRLAALYPGGRSDYLARFTPALDAAIAGGFVLAADRAEILALAAAGWAGAA